MKSTKNSLSPESKTMKFFNRVGLEKVAWSLRRLHCPVADDALVLEVGSGGNPYPRANVLLDAYEYTRERHWVPLIVDRPFVFGYIEHLPFKSGSFDFVIASHVLEHSRNPEQTLAEFQRVAKAGYIEVPDAFMERVNPYKDHRLEITVRNSKLLIHKKSNWLLDAELVELYEERVKRVMTGELVPNHPSNFHVRYYWQDKIDYEIINPDVDISWSPPASNNLNSSKSSGLTIPLRDWILSFLRTALSQKTRNRQIDIIPFLRCLHCKSEQGLTQCGGILECEACHTSYPMKNGVPVIYPDKQGG